LAKPSRRPFALHLRWAWQRKDHAGNTLDGGAGKSYNDAWRPERFDILLLSPGEREAQHRDGDLQGARISDLREETEAFHHAQAFFDSDQKAEYTLSTAEALWSIFRNLALDPEIGLVYYLLDGLDECDTDLVRILGAKFSELFRRGDNKPFASKLRLIIVIREIHALKGSPTIQLDF
jgi:hypothetical protein